LTRRVFPLVAAIAAAALFVATACDGGDSNSDTAAVISAINILDKAGLHDIDTSINSDKKVPATARITALHAQTIVLSTTWPSDTKAASKKLADIFGQLAAALDADSPDLKKAGDAAHAAHEGEHDFSNDVWSYLQKKAKVAAGTAPDAD
jgi:hypothetical protein